MPNRRTPNTEESEIIALKALGFLAADPDRLERFLALTGMTPQAIRPLAADPMFLGGVLDHLLSDQTLLLVFAETAGLTPGGIEAARASLPGAANDF
ncbi:MAG: DUF3572 domain-containing protein [Alphaproteobacteria bacterium]|nr:DUF3572 domain-containing protein [Alphaproteobacteria bacterium]